MWMDGGGESGVFAVGLGLDLLPKPHDLFT